MPSDSTRPLLRGRPPRRDGVWGKLLLLAMLTALFILPFTGAGRRLKQGAIDVIRAAKEPVIVVEKAEPVVVEKEKIVEREKIVYRDPPPEPEPDRFVSKRNVDIAELFNGIKIKTELETEPGNIASRERKADDAYMASFSLKIKIPRPNTTLEELAELNPELPKALPGLTVMLPNAKVSNYFYRLYEIKQKLVQQNLTRLDKALTRHNFFDCETVLELKHPETGQCVLFFQGEMDVVSDGSDGDRMTSFDDYIYKSQHFQATTSYSWKKLTNQPNPVLPKLEADLEAAQQKLAAATTAAAKKSITGDIDYLKKTIAHLKTTSFLIAQEDPFIVLSLSARQYPGDPAFAPQLGDYAVVISGGKLFPAIVGDYGPRHLAGEASLRIAREINPKASPYNRAVSDLKVSYLIFPNSADRPFSQPNYAKWRARCAEYLAKIGGIGEGYELHEWEDRLLKKRLEQEAAAAAANQANPNPTGSEVNPPAELPAPTTVSPAGSQ